ncbi:hypothetical protein ES708_22453 [subsurface metagenome]
MAKAHQPEPEGQEMVVGVVTQGNLGPVLEVRLGENAAHVSKKGYSHSGAMPELVSE